MSDATQAQDHIEADVGAMRVARVYAQALLDAATKQHKADEVLGRPLTLLMPDEIHDALIRIRPTKLSWWTYTSE